MCINIHVCVCGEGVQIHGCMHHTHRLSGTYMHTHEHHMCMHASCMNYRIHTRTDTYTHTLLHQEVISAHSLTHTHTHTASPLRHLRPTHTHTHTHTHKNQSQGDRQSISKNTQHHTHSIRTQKIHNQKTNTDAHTCLRISNVTGNFLPPSTAAMANPNDPASERARVVLLARAL